MATDTVRPGNYGDNPNGPPSGGTYNPQYMAVAHLRSDGWNVNGIHAHFSAPNMNANARLALAGALMLAKLEGGHPRFDYPGAPEQPYVKPDGSYAQYPDFREFGFGSQHDIYVFLEHGPDELKLTDGAIAMIAPQLRNGKPGAANHAFYSTREVTSQLTPDLARRGSMFLMENHFTTRGNQPINPKTETFKYKVCFLYTAASGIGMVIDPDGTNGGSKP